VNSKKRKRIPNREKYVCKFCQCNDRERFTTGSFYECRKCRAERSKDIHFEQYSAALKRQQLSIVHWKARTYNEKR